MFLRVEYSVKYINTTDIKHKRPAKCNKFSCNTNTYILKCFNMFMLTY